MPTDPSDHRENAGRPRNRPRWSLAVLLMFGIGGVMFHSQLLQWVYGILVVNEPAESCRYGWLATTGPECYDATVQLLTDESIEQVLLVDPKPRRSVVLGAMPEFEDRAAIELVARGAMPQQYRVINTQAMTPHQLIREADAEIGQDNDATCLVISAATKSGYLRHVIDQALPAERADRYRVRAIEIEHAQPSTWWRSRRGVALVMVHGLRLIFVRCFGQSEVDDRDPYQHVVDRVART